MTANLPKWIQDEIDIRAHELGPAYTPLFRRDAEWGAHLVLDRLEKTKENDHDVSGDKTGIINTFNNGRQSVRDEVMGDG